MILESFGDDIEAGMNFTKFGKLLIDFANVMQKTSSKDKWATLGRAALLWRGKGVHDCCYEDQKQILLHVLK